MTTRPWEPGDDPSGEADPADSPDALAPGEGDLGDQEPIGSQHPPHLDATTAPMEEGALVRGLPMGAVIAVGLVVAAVVAILVLGG